MGSGNAGVPNLTAGDFTGACFMDRPRTAFTAMFAEPVPVQSQVFIELLRLLSALQTILYCKQMCSGD